MKFVIADLCHVHQVSNDYFVMVKTRSSQGIPDPDKLIIPIAELANEHKMLISSANINLEHSWIDLLTNWVAYDKVLDYTQYRNSPIKLVSYEEAQFIPIDMVKRIHTVPDGSCGYQAFGLALNISWMDIFRAMIELWRDSSQYAELANSAASEVDLDTCSNLESKYWLTSEFANMLANHFQVIVIVSMFCSKICGFIAIDVTIAESSSVFNKDILIEYTINHYNYLKPCPTMKKELRIILRKVYDITLKIKNVEINNEIDKRFDELIDGTSLSGSSSSSFSSGK
jgi:hypothetical protein